MAVRGSMEWCDKPCRDEGLVQKRPRPARTRARRPRTTTRWSAYPWAVDRFSAASKSCLVHLTSCIPLLRDQSVAVRNERFGPSGCRLWSGSTVNGKRFEVHLDLVDCVLGRDLVDGRHRENWFTHVGGFVGQNGGLRILVALPGFGRKRTAPRRHPAPLPHRPCSGLRSYRCCETRP